MGLEVWSMSIRYLKDAWGKSWADLDYGMSLVVIVWGLIRVVPFKDTDKVS